MDAKGAVAFAIPGQQRSVGSKGHRSPENVYIFSGCNVQHGAVQAPKRSEGVGLPGSRTGPTECRMLARFDVDGDPIEAVGETVTALRSAPEASLLMAARHWAASHTRSASRASTILRLSRTAWLLGTEFRHGALQASNRAWAEVAPSMSHL
jgi:hypothetical protein